MDMPDDPAAHGELPVEITHPERVIDAKSGARKADLARAMVRLAPLVWPFARRRILTLVRCPRGIDGRCFFQRHPPPGEMPPGVAAVAIAHATSEDGACGRSFARPGLHLTDPVGLVSLVQIGVVELHGRAATADRPMHPDWMIFDLDPAPDVDFVRVVEAARIIAALLKTMDLRSFVKTTGGRGLHVTVPLDARVSFAQIRLFARRLAEGMAACAPDRFVSSSRRRARRGRIFVDHLRNHPAASAVLPWSPRARPGLPVARPVSWAALDALRSAREFRIGDVLARPPGARLDDPWRDFFRSRRPLPGIEALARALDAELPRLVGR